MGKIDTSGWKEFRVGELFAAERGKVKNIQPLCPGETPIIAAGAYNQGITGMYEIDSAYENRITISCNGAGCGSTFYHPYKFNVNGDAITLIEKSSMSDKAKSFIACILNGAFTRKYSYEEKCSPQKALNEIVRLPATPDGAPDWAYMESYMANLETKVAELLTLLQAAKDAEKKKVDTREWGEFRVGELFEVKISKSVDKGGLEFAEDGEYDFIGRTPLNNGIQGRLNKLKFEANQEGTYSIAQIGMHVCQYRERKWYASQNIFVLTPFAEKSHKANKFIATIITRYLDCAYGKDTYATYPTAKTLPHLKIKLPVDKTGQPDWAYMEEYMRKMEERVKVMMGKYEMTVNEAAL